MRLLGATRAWTLAAFLLLPATALPGGAAATADDGGLAGALASALARDPSLVVHAAFEQTPARGTPNAVSSTPLAGFPVHGGEYAVLTSGNATLAGEPNDSTATGAALGGASARNGSDHDASVLRLDLELPPGTCALGLAVRFLSDEFPESTGTWFDDGVVVELDRTTWRLVNGTLHAPYNVALDADGSPLTVNTASVTAAAAAGTTYDAATDAIALQIPVKSGRHALYLSVFDGYDDNVDSAAFVDDLHVVGGCAEPPVAIATASHVAVAPGERVVFDGSASQAGYDASLVAFEWRIDGAVVSTAPTFATSFGAPGLVCAALRVTNDRGLSADDEACVDVDDALKVAASPTRRVYGVADEAIVVVFVGTAGGAPIGNATVRLDARWHVEGHDVDAVAGGSTCARWVGEARTDARGIAILSVPPASARCAPLPSLLEAPGGYAAAITAERDRRAGEGAAEWQVQPMLS